MKAIDEIKNMSNEEFIVEIWGDAGKAVLTAIDAQDKTTMTFKDFLSHCTACGGNWGGMLLTGIRELWPAVYDAIPDDMGFMAWNGLCITLALLGVHEFEKKE